MIYKNKYCSYDDERCILRVKDGIEEFYKHFMYKDAHDYILDKEIDLRNEILSNEVYSMVLPDSMKILHKEAFWGMNMSSIEIPDSIELIEEEVFSNCTWLTKIVWPSAAKSIMKDTFFNCNALEEVSLPEGLLTIEDEAFRFCESLKKIVIPSTVEELGTGVFLCCIRLNEIHVPRSLYDKYKYNKNKDAYFNYSTFAEVIPYDEPVNKIDAADTKASNAIETVSLTTGRTKSYSGKIRTNLIAEKKKVNGKGGE